MHHPDHHIKVEYRESVLNVLHYINRNLTGDLSLDMLAQVANYSPFHFQKIFSEVVRESPKQYVKRLKVERAANHLKVFPELPVFDIAVECGFSSPAVFARAFKNYFGISPETFRGMNMDDIKSTSSAFNEKNYEDIEGAQAWTSNVGDPMEKIAPIEIKPPPVIGTLPAFKILYIQTSLSHPENVPLAFKSIVKWALPRDLITPYTKYIGVWLDVPFYTPPEKCRYLAGILVDDSVKTNKGVDEQILQEGKYAEFSMVGDLEKTFYHLVALNHKFLEDIGYTIADITCCEIFDECPTSQSYAHLIKRIVVPVVS